MYFMNKVYISIFLFFFFNFIIINVYGVAK